MKKINVSKKHIAYIIIFLSIILLGMFSITNNKEQKESNNETVETYSNKELKDKINQMTLDEKIGQMIVMGFDGTSINEELETIINDLSVGGVILFSRNIESSNQLKNLTNNINEISKGIKPFISIDEEGGRVSRLPDDVEKFESAMDIGKKNSEEYAYENARKLGNVLKEHNINMNFAPVLDIFSNPKNTVIGDRAYGSDANIVTKMGIATMEGLEKENIIPVIKHFPGHGDTEIDSHYGLPVVHKSIDELEEFELVPFKEAIKKGSDVVMISHILIDSIDTQNPSTMSYEVITNLLREKLEFDGVVITDDMMMQAITDNTSIESASVESIKAGSDIILVGSGVDTVKSIVDNIKNAIKNGKISEERIDESVLRILKLKEKYNII